MFTEKELWQIAGLVQYIEYAEIPDFKLGLKVLAMLPDSAMKTSYQELYEKKIKVLVQKERQDEYDTEIHIASHYMK